jgi:hypothetical protein
MTTTIKCWEISEGTEPRELQIGGLRFEEHLENWLERDITMLSTDLVVVGRQVNNIDLIAVDDEGRAVVIELKRDQVPREAIAQAIDYVSLASEWPAAKIIQMAEEYFSRADWLDFGSLDDAFLARFGKNLEDVSLNSSQRIILVGVRMEVGVERMVEWLSENGVDINIALFTFHELEEGHYILARTFAISEEVTAARSAAKSGRRLPISGEEFQEAVSKNKLEQHIKAFDALRSHPVFRDRWGLDGLDLEVEIPREGERPLRRKGVQILTSLSKQGALRVGISLHNLAERLQIPSREIENKLRAFQRDPNVRWRYDTELKSPEQTEALASTLLSLIDSSPAEGAGLGNPTTQQTGGK